MNADEPTRLPTAASLDRLRRPRPDRRRRRRAGSACAGGLARQPARFFPAYLVGFLFWVGISLGLPGGLDAPPPGRRRLGLPDPPAARGRRR